jgi:hypothetical protein
VEGLEGGKVWFETRILGDRVKLKDDVNIKDVTSSPR